MTDKEYEPIDAQDAAYDMDLSIVFTNCNVCGRKLHGEDEHQMGMCSVCAGVSDEATPCTTL